MKCVFIGGCDRSGTTMLGSMLGGGEDVIVTPESQFLWQVFNAISGRSEITTQEIIDKISCHWRFKIWEVHVSGLAPSDNPSLIGRYSECVTRIVKEYAEVKGVHDPRVWVDHTPNSIQHIGLISSILNGAKFIHIVRDGRGVASSFKKLNWGPNSVIESANWWSRKIAYGLAAESRYAGEKLLKVRFEDIINEPEKELRKICDFAGMEFKSKMLLGGRFDTPKYTLGQHGLVGGQPDKSKIDSWQDILTKREIEIFEYQVSELLPYLGYELVFRSNVIAPKKYEKIKFTLIGFKAINNYIAQVYRRLTKVLFKN